MELILIISLILKHFICDFPLQKSRHFLHKGRYGHWGGIEHALIHGGGTCFVGAFFTQDFWTLALLDAVIHYHVDWFKMWWTAKKGYTPQDEMFWIWLGIDQMIHYLTYVLITWAVCS